MEQHRGYIEEVVVAMDREAREQSHAYTNQSRVKPPVYQPGTLILVKNHIKMVVGAKPKLQRQFRGPYIVLRMTGAVTVEFRPIASMVEADTIHVDNTKPFLDQAGKTVVLSSYREIQQLDAGDDELSSGDDDQVKSSAYEVDQVMDHRLAGGSIEFLLRWKGYGPEDDTWTPESDMLCHNLVEEYFQRLGAIQDF